MRAKFIVASFQLSSLAFKKLFPPAVTGITNFLSSLTGLFIWSWRMPSLERLGYCQRRRRGIFVEPKPKPD
jgi:hypothetical protein